MKKTTLRQRYCCVREDLSHYQVSLASADLCRRLVEWPILQKAERVLTYLAFRNELDLSPLMALMPHIQWIAPRIEGPRLTLHPYNAARLVRHRFGMLEPAQDLPVIDPATLDIVLVPGVAFDRTGGRLGFGGGYYDRLLPTTEASRVGVTYTQCLLEAVPCQEHDQHMDWIATPTELVCCSPPSS
jgi:5-formyltetrahydrofolate cyclo-ligase